ncbi:DUF192 domain-containing protein [Salirhabdus sp. Marseille-P4669]|uniref:DUF192 domain-containing protein n=1 Tax=Salirhabdus sp. Marseille-P4669 TaxID=2042310 RepID=UPI000C7B2734|nr:DUF192 domain-containing protein [Salirhabdus sp. Marseille-P4669]
MDIIRNDQRIFFPLDIYRYDTFFKRFKGLMFRLKPITKEGILLIPCNSIHMFFMFFSIDVVFLNKDNSVIKIYPYVKPWRVIPPVKGANAAIELPKGTIDTYNITIGDRFIIEKSKN